MCFSMFITRRKSPSWNSTLLPGVSVRLMETPERVRFSISLLFRVVATDKGLTFIRKSSLRKYGCLLRHETLDVTEINLNVRRLPQGRQEVISRSLGLGFPTVDRIEMSIRPLECNVLPTSQESESQGFDQATESKSIPRFNQVQAQKAPSRPDILSQPE